jgi:hypothetical protein
MLKLNSKGVPIYPTFGKINENDPFVFVHVSKTAGTSLRQAMFACGMERRVDHVSAVSYTKANEKIEKPMYAIVRNPLDRLLSSYYWGKTRPDVWWPEKRSEALRKSRTIYEFCDRIQEEYENDIGRLLVFKRQTDYVCDEKGFVIPEIWPFENVADFWRMIKSKYFPESKVALPHKNKTAHPHFTEILDEKCESVIREIYKDDFILYEHAVQMQMQRDLLLKKRASFRMSDLPDGLYPIGQDGTIMVDGNQEIGNG